MHSSPTESVTVEEREREYPVHDWPIRVVGREV